MITKVFNAVSFALMSLLLSSSAFAVDHTAEISAAAADGVTNTTGAVTGILGIVAVVVGISLVIAIMRKV